MLINKDIIIERIQSFLYSFYAKDIKTAREIEIYDCLCRYIMEILGEKRVGSKKVRDGYEVYVLSFEYLPGKLLGNFIYKLGIMNEISDALYDMGFEYERILSFDKEPAIGIGDIGIGSSFLINELTNQGIKATAYALRYEGGNFKQSIKEGRQVAKSNYGLHEGSNFEHQKVFNSIININGREHKSIAYDMPVISVDTNHVNTMRLFKSVPTKSIDMMDFSRGDLINAYDDLINNNSLTEFLYVDDSSYEGKILRLKQEYFYAAASIRDIFRRYELYYDDIRKIDEHINIIVNDIHPTLALIEFIRILNQDYNFTIKDAIIKVRNIFYHLVFSVTDDSLERYPMDMIKDMNNEIFNIILLVQRELTLEKNSLDIVIDGNIIFKNINLNLSKSYIFLSKILYENKYDYKNVNFMNFGTDRVLYAKSNNLNLMKVLDKYNIKSLKNDEIKKMEDLIDNRDFIEDLEEAKYKNKLHLIDKLSLNKENINPYSIFDVELSMMHESKRQILNLMSIANRYYYLRNNSNINSTPVTYIFSGKANDGYFMAKETIKLIIALKKLIDSDKFVKEKIKIVFIEDLDVSKARLIYPATDIYSNLTLPILDNQNFAVLNSIFNMSNIVSTRGGIVDNLTVSNKFYLFGDSYEKVHYRKMMQNYNANDFYYANEEVKYTIENLLREDYNKFPYDFKTIYDEILLYNDSFNIFYDLKSLIEIRQMADKDYLDKNEWVKREIQNILRAQEFNLNHLLKRKDNIGKEYK